MSSPTFSPFLSDVTAVHLKKKPRFSVVESRAPEQGSDPESDTENMVNETEEDLEITNEEDLQISNIADRKQSFWYRIEKHGNCNIP